MQLDSLPEWISSSFFGLKSSFEYDNGYHNHHWARREKRPIFPKCTLLKSIFFHCQTSKIMKKRSKQLRPKTCLGPDSVCLTWNITISITFYIPLSFLFHMNGKRETHTRTHTLQSALKPILDWARENGIPKTMIHIHPSIHLSIFNHFTYCLH